MPIANCRFGQVITTTLFSNRKSAIENRKYLGWSTCPGSQKLGAKWVEVKKRSGDKASCDESEFETWPATPVTASPKSELLDSAEMPKLLL